jgi:16S rRNA (cytidine1402-2'-O)-methyltransferase
VLYLIATPLGNLKDITFRAVETLKSCDLILCEDTRHSKKLLDTYNISTKLVSYHKFNEQQKLSSIISELKEGRNIALISDAGTPCIQDPGSRLVKSCFIEGLEITSLPGPSALTTTMSLCSEEGPYQFVGFLPKKDSELKKALSECFNYNGQSFCYVSSHQIIKVLETIHKLDEKRELFLAKELTKLYEKFFHGTAENLLETLKKNPPRGEFVLMIKFREISDDLINLSIADHVATLEKKYHLSKNEAIKLAAKQRKVHKNIIYKEIHTS